VAWLTVRLTRKSAGRGRIEWSIGWIAILLLVPAAVGQGMAIRHTPVPSPTPATLPSAVSFRSGVGAVRTASGPVRAPTVKAYSGTTGGIDPFEYLHGEPAPMGVADFGVASANGAWYRYSTPEVIGNASIHSLRAFNSTRQLPGVSFQLNTQLVLTNGSATAVYWFQDIAALNTSNNLVYFGDNVWNLSANSTTSGILPGSLAGNGSVDTSRGYSLYDGIAPNGDPGNGVDLGYPANISLEMFAADIQGVPHVGLAYEDGGGWQTYDNVSVPWAHGWEFDGFVVDGSQLDPLQGFYDLEWVLAGPGDDLADLASSASLTMGLQYWNGHNLQTPSNAYDFGGNTGDTMKNISESSGLDSTGVPDARLTAGPGSIGLLYGSATSAEVNVTANITQGTLRVGSSLVAFSGGAINLTLGPGTYNLTLLGGAAVIATASVNLSAGEFLAMFLGGIHPVPVWFNETGLVPGTSWTVVFDGVSHQSTTPYVSFAVDPGSYPYSYGTVPGYRTPEPSRSLAVLGPTPVAVPWTVAMYTVLLESIGLPNGAVWNATLDGTTNSSGSAVLSFELPNGTFSLTVGAGAEFSSNDSGTPITVDGMNQSVDIYFQPIPGLLEGSISPSSANVYLNGSGVPVSHGTFEASLAPGSYRVTATESGFVAYAQTILIHSGAITTLGIQLNATGGPSGGMIAPANGLTTVDLALIGTAVAIIAVLAMAVLVLRRR
jgi:hypothetical protein